MGGVGGVGRPVRILGGPLGRVNAGPAEEGDFRGWLQGGGMAFLICAFVEFVDDPGESVGGFIAAVAALAKHNQMWLYYFYKILLQGTGTFKKGVSFLPPMRRPVFVDEPAPNNYYYSSLGLSMKSQRAGQRLLMEPASVHYLLPEARPLQAKQPRKAETLFEFASEPCKDESQMTEGPCELERSSEQRNRSKHEIGQSLIDLFSSPNVKVYQSYEKLQLGADNIKFGSCKAKVGQDQLLKGFKDYTNIGLNRNNLQFQSRFESGNLAVACEVADNAREYYLALQQDCNTSATCQWYYFSISNALNLGTYTFHIVNLTKNYSSYQYGMKPCVNSKQSNEGWKRAGFNISYRENSLRYGPTRNYYTFSFSYDFNHQNDTVYFAYSYPYTYSRLQNFLTLMQTRYPSLINVKSLTNTPLGNSVELVTITSPTKVEEVQPNNKDTLIISARVHPGQTVSSYVCESLIQFLLGSSTQACNLREQNIIRIVPMLNPDGVIHGSYRASLSGSDLNRRWKRPDPDFHPEIYNLKKIFARSLKKPILYIDLHGHSKKKSSFMYGCLDAQCPYLCKELPFFLSKKAHAFSYANCNFSTPAGKDGTSRLTVWRQFGVSLSYTMEMSFCGPSRTTKHFTMKDYLLIGQSLGKSLGEYLNHRYNPSPAIEQVVKTLYASPEYLTHGENDSNGSASDVESQLEFAQIVEQQEPIQKKKESLSSFATSMQFGIKILHEKGSNIKKIEGQSSNPSFVHGRRYIAPSRVSIQRISSNHEGFSVDRIRSTEFSALKKQHPKGWVQNQQWRRSQIRQGYRPYSHSKALGSTDSLAKYRQNRNHPDNSFILPSVVRRQELKYRTFRNKEASFDFSLEMQKEHASLMITSKKEITLNEKIQQISSAPNRRAFQTQRHWARQR